MKSQLWPGKIFPYHTYTRLKQVHSSFLVLTYIWPHYFGHNEKTVQCFLICLHFILYNTSTFYAFYISKDNFSTRADTLKRRTEKNQSFHRYPLLINLNTKCTFDSTFKRSQTVKKKKAKKTKKNKDIWYVVIEKCLYFFLLITVKTSRPAIS